MYNNKHTPGPWKIGGDAYTHAIVAPDGTVIARLDVPEQASKGHNDKENARLIYAAPELLEALEDLRDLYISVTEMTDTYCDVCQAHAYKYVDERNEWTGEVDPIVHKPGCIIGKVESAIAKARGES